MSEQNTVRLSKKSMQQLEEVLNGDTANDLPEELSHRTIQSFSSLIGHAEFESLTMPIFFLFLSPDGTWSAFRIDGTRVTGAKGGDGGPPPTFFVPIGFVWSAQQTITIPFDETAWGDPKVPKGYEVEFYVVPTG